MPQFYLEEYGRALTGRRVFIACREGILRDHHKSIIADIKFLHRFGAETTLFHNLPHRKANQKLLGILESRLPRTQLIRIAAGEDFYEAALAYPEPIYKLIFLERRPLVDERGQKINAITTARARRAEIDFGDIAANINLKDMLKKVCLKIEAGHCERVHFLPAGKDAIKLELFTVEGCGTLIANNFQEEFRQVETDEEVAIVHRILTAYKRMGFLRPRSKSYISEHRRQFYVTAIDGIVVGCVEGKPIDERAMELGALAISERFRNQRIGVFTVTSLITMMRQRGIDRFISLSNNPQLETLYLTLEFIKKTPQQYQWRQDISPHVMMFFKEYPPL
ncbi:MAG: GNAT family N-acetyltransferase [Desulfobulbaceae bacterium]|jgi:N-acetylglutamate synthase-like GNAT family acetyltransferase|nr:GNAT family N-acetyltransferase [Desulfobulbaceae bacterium]